MEKKTDCVCRRIIDKTDKNWKRISFNDFGVQYSQEFINAKKKEKILWKKNLLSQRSMRNLKEE